MALIDCPECQKQISEQAVACPHCGFPQRDAKRAEKWTMPLLDPLAEVAGFIEEMAGALRRSLRTEGEKEPPAKPPPPDAAGGEKENAG
ncbi:MAG: hypothetical protein WDA20_07485 [Desulfuromonadales bacterium]|jgi:hypothetical protein